MDTAGITALSANKPELLRTIFLTRVREEHRTGVPNTPLIIPLTDGVSRTSEGYKFLPGHERHLVPRSEYLFKFLQPEIEDLLFLGRSYETYFDEFEIMWALVNADLTSEKSHHFWGPPGRFAWKQSHRSPSPLDQLIMDAERQRDKWPPLKVGFFRGSIERFLEVANAYRELLLKHPLR